MKCSDNEWQHCQVEKMGCSGCYYDEIDPEEYVRTESGDIFIVDEEKKVLQGLKFLNAQYGNIVSHSKNIIDLVEVGDFVNGFEVIEVDLKHEVDNQICVSTPTVKELYLLDEDIKSILTKEQFKESEFIVNR